MVGCVLGLALGDAAGAPFEFRRAHEIPDPIPLFELPWAGGPAGSTTDDTALARNLVVSLTERQGFDPDDLVARHLEWFRTGPPDVGNQTRLVLERADRGEPAADAARAVWESRGPEVSAGNGSVMYCAPLGAAFASHMDWVFRAAPALSALTHHDARCGTACLAVTLAAASLVLSGEPERSIRDVLTHLIAEDREGAEELEFLVGAAGTQRPVDGPDQGFCLFTAGIALRVAITAPMYEAGIREVIALGGDTDTNAAVAGALLGARDGLDALPPEWRSKLLEHDAIERDARALADAFA